MKRDSYSNLSREQVEEFNGGKKYFCEKDIRIFYSRENKQDKEKLIERFCSEEGLLIILPTISSLITELSKMLEKIMSLYESNPMLLENIQPLSIQAFQAES